MAATSLTDVPLTVTSSDVRPVVGSISSTLVAKVEFEDGAHPMRVPRALKNTTLHRFRTGPAPLTGVRCKLCAIVGKEGPYKHEHADDATAEHLQFPRIASLVKTAGAPGVTTYTAFV